MYFGNKFGGGDFNPPEGFSAGYAERQPMVIDPWQRRTVWPGNKPTVIVLSNELEPAGNEIMFWILQLMNIFTRGKSQTYAAEFPNILTVLWDLISGIGSSDNIGDFIGGAFASHDASVPHHMLLMDSKMPRIQKVDLTGDGDILSAGIDTRHKLLELTEDDEDTIKEIVR